MTSEAPITIANVRFAAMNLLARREHSAQELHTKLLNKFDQLELVQAAVARLTEQGLQSDERFAEAFTTMRQRQGKGSSLIKMELRERGVSADIIAGLIDESDSLWSSLAEDVRIKRFGAQLPLELKEKARQMRFLQARGFASRHIQPLFAD
jgi:regulatory protein